MTTTPPEPPEPSESSESSGSPKPDQPAEPESPQTPPSSQSSDKPADRSPEEPEEPVQPPSSPIIEPPASAVTPGPGNQEPEQQPGEVPRYPGPDQQYPGPDQQYPPPPPLPPEAYPTYSGGQGYDYGGYGAPPVRRRNGMGTAALVLGIVGFLIGPASILAIIFGRIGLTRVARGEATNRGVAQAGFVLGIVTLLLWILGLILIANQH
ncbi:hypothetical protein ABIA35_005038 [Catenulispora sp. MAP12-49]|uniref:DUF4190 domain-containing protein n=1 Tax=unclassified Catenulispora TaxID=414885 RepID=UPI0035166223